MTQISARDRAASGSPPLRQRRKAVLICPRCGHESTPTGDWIETVRDRTIDLSCPDCRKHIATRPRE